MEDDILKINRKSMYIIFFINALLLGPYFIDIYIIKYIYRENFIRQFLFISGNLILLIATSIIASRLVLNIFLSKISEKTIKFRYFPRTLNLYKKMSGFLIFLLYLAYITIILYGHQYYLLFAISYLAMNFVNNATNRIYLLNKKLFIWNPWYLNNKLNYVTSYKDRNNELILLLDNQEQIVIEENHYREVIDIIESMNINRI